MKEIRLYYESLEQGFDYIRPIIESVSRGQADIVYVRRPKKSSDLSEGSISAILSMTTPDALITGVVNGKEYPLVLIEFTEAVTTEDHELQRTYGGIAAYLSGIYYLKIAGEKKSEKEFGGAPYNPYSTPRIFIDKVGYEGYIIANWDTQQGNDFTLERNQSLPSCPPDIPILKDTIQSAVIGFLYGPEDWYANSLELLKKRDSYIKYRKLVDQASGADDLLESWRNRRDSNLNKLRYFVRKDFVAAKINRFSHAMDPDRGIVTFMSFLFSEEYKVYGIYALVRPRGGDVLKKDMNSLSSMREKLAAAFEKDDEAGGLPSWLTKEITAIANKAKSLEDVINIQYIWEKYADRICESKVVMTLAYFLDGLKLNHNGILLVWDKRKLVNTKSANFIPAYSKRFNFGVITKPTPIIPVINEVDEDEVTYTIVHKVLIPNGFRIVSVSYPGAQGGNAVLPEPEKGKAQKREYPDTIAIPPAGSSISVVLNESKGMFNASQLAQDTKKLLLYKTSTAHKKALKETLFVAKVIDLNDNLKDIVVGVSFGVLSRSATRWQPDEVDFIFRIVDRKRWAIGIFKQEMKDLISKIEGNTDFPDVQVLDPSADAGLF